MVSLSPRLRSSRARSIALCLGFFTGCAMEPGPEESTAGDGEASAAHDLVVRAGYASLLGFVLDEAELAVVEEQLDEGERLVAAVGTFDVPLAAGQLAVDLALTDGEELPLYAVSPAERRRIGSLRVSVVSDESLLDDGFLFEGEGVEAQASCAHGGTRWVWAGTCDSTCNLWYGVLNGCGGAAYDGRQRQQMCIYGSRYWTNHYRCRPKCCGG